MPLSFVNRQLPVSFTNKIRYISWPLVVVVITLGLCGVAMQFSASGGNLRPYAEPQLIRFIIGLCVMFTAAFLSPRLIYHYTYHLYAAGFVMLVIVEIVGHIGMGAQRWVSLGFFNLQPSEFMKVFMVLALAKFYHTVNVDQVDNKYSMLPPLLMIGAPALLILIQPNLGTATVLTATGVAILFAAGIKAWKFIVVGLIGVASLPVAWSMLHSYQKRRVMTFLDPESDPLGAGYNIMQSKIAIGSGGTTGKGFLEGTQSQLSFLPEKQTDFIFTMLAEEFGMAGGLSVIILFFILVMLCLMAGVLSRHHFGRMIAVGVATVLFLHIFINIAMVMGMLPVVGLPLPLLSYGGSVMISSMLGIGLVLNIYIHREMNLHRDSRGTYK
jgi:rod shape determining protein RodA